MDIDDDDLLRAQKARGFIRIRETVAAGLREIAVTEARKREIHRHTSGALALLARPSERADAWR